MKRISACFIVGAGGLAGVLMSAPAHALTIDVTYDASVPTAMENAFNAVVAEYDAAFTNNITTYVYVSLGSVGQSPLDSGNIGETKPTYYSASSYSGVATALQNQYSATGFSAYLPASNPLTVSNFLVPEPEARLLNATTPGTITSPTFHTGPSGANPGYDGYIGFSAAPTYSYSDTGGTPAGTIDFTGLAKHELQHFLGRTSTLDGTGVTSNLFATPFDLFRYSAKGVHSFTLTPAKKAYLSVDNGQTNLGYFSDAADNGAYPDDWWSPINSTNTDANDALIQTGLSYGLSLSDEAGMEALGWTISANNGGGLFVSADAPVGASVPEPATLALLGVGLPALVRVRRRRMARG